MPRPDRPDRLPIQGQQADRSQHDHQTTDQLEREAGRRRSRRIEISGAGCVVEARVTGIGKIDQQEDQQDRDSHPEQWDQGLTGSGHDCPDQGSEGSEGGDDHERPVLAEQGYGFDRQAEPIFERVGRDELGGDRDPGSKQDRQGGEAGR